MLTEVIELTKITKPEKADAGDDLFGKVARKKSFRKLSVKLPPAERENGHRSFRKLDPAPISAKELLLAFAQWRKRTKLHSPRA